MTELELLNKLRVKYGMYLGEKSLTALFHYSSGYSRGVVDCGQEMPQTIMKAMQNFVRNWYDIPGHFHWPRILLMVCGSEEAAFDKFFELLDLYLQGVDPETRELKSLPETTEEDTENRSEN